MAETRRLVADGERTISRRCVNAVAGRVSFRVRVFRWVARRRAAEIWSRAERAAMAAAGRMG